MLLSSQLHPSLENPSLSSVKFLTEIMAKYPDAISFGPGAPNRDLLGDLDFDRYLDRFLGHLRDRRQIDGKSAKFALMEYGPTGGLVNDLIATALDHDQGIRVPAEAVVVTVGAQEAMLLVLRAIFRSTSDRLAVVDPAYVGILGAARLLDLDVIGLPEAEEGRNLARLDEACRSARQDHRPIRAFYVTPDFSNPSGSVMSLQVRRELLELAETHDFYVIEDNTYAFTAPVGEQLPSLKTLDVSRRVILIGTFAKCAIPGLRVGYLVADQLVSRGGREAHYLASDLATIKSMTTVNTSPICQAIVGGMLLENGVSITALGRAKADFYRANLRTLLDSLDRHLTAGRLRGMPIRWNQPRGGFFVRVELPVKADMQLLRRSAEEFGVLWTPMSQFYVSDGGRNDLRLSCSYLSTGQIEQGVERLVNFFLSLPYRGNQS